MSSQTNEFHRHHARAAEQNWAAHRYIAMIGHGLMSAGIAPVRTFRRFFSPAVAWSVWTLTLRLLTKPSP